MISSIQEFRECLLVKHVFGQELITFGSWVAQIGVALAWQKPRDVVRDALLRVPRGHLTGPFSVSTAPLLREHVLVERSDHNKHAIAPSFQQPDSLLEEARIVGTTKVVVSNDPPSAIQTTSRNAALVILGMQPPQPGSEDEFFYRTERLVGRLERVALVQSAGGMRLES